MFLFCTVIGGIIAGVLVILLIAVVSLIVSIIIKRRKKSKYNYFINITTNLICVILFIGTTSEQDSTEVSLHDFSYTCGHVVNSFMTCNKFLFSTPIDY